MISNVISRFHKLNSDKSKGSKSVIYVNKPSLENSSIES